MLTDLETTTLARAWPWSFAEVEEASRTAFAFGWSVDQLVGFLDGVAGAQWVYPGYCIHPHNAVLAVVQLANTKTWGVAA